MGQVAFNQSTTINQLRFAHFEFELILEKVPPRCCRDKKLKSQKLKAGDDKY